MGTVAKSDITALRLAIDALVRTFKITEGHRAAGDTAKLNPADVQALLFIRANPGCIANDVALFLGVVPTTSSAIVDRLVKRKLVKRSRTEANRRIVELSLTATGASRVKAIVDEQNSHCRQMLARLDPDERAVFLDSIAKIAFEKS